MDIGLAGKTALVLGAGLLHHRFHRTCGWRTDPNHL